jgi:hypothetical protein
LETTKNLDFVGLLNAFTEFMAAKFSAKLAAEGEKGDKIRAWLLTVGEAIYPGRIKEAVQHLIASGKLSAVRSDYRVFLDRNALQHWIENIGLRLGDAYTRSENPPEAA